MVVFGVVPCLFRLVPLGFLVVPGGSGWFRVGSVWFRVVPCGSVWFRVGSWVVPGVSVWSPGVAGCSVMVPGGLLWVRACTAGTIATRVVSELVAVLTRVGPLASVSIWSSYCTFRLFLVVRRLVTP